MARPFPAPGGGGSRRGPLGEPGQRPRAPTASISLGFLFAFFTATGLAVGLGLAFLVAGPLLGGPVAGLGLAALTCLGISLPACLLASRVVAGARSPGTQGVAEGADGGRAEAAALPGLDETELGLEAEFETALFSGAIEPWFQPKYDPSGAIVGAEALARWRLPDGGLRLPADFIPLAERSGAIVALGAVILHRACEEAASWTAAGLEPIPVSVNLSMYQFSSPDLVSRVQSALERTGLDPARLELEITESALVSAEDEAARRLAELRDLGLSLSIDDFGTGFSSISRLRDYPVHALKVPKDIVDPLPADPRASTIARAVIDLAHDLDFWVVAEGVEDEAQFEWLKAARCDQYQGHLFSPALSPEGFAAALANTKAPSLE